MIPKRTFDTAYDPIKGIWTLIEDLFPICRSITGDGVRQTLRTIGKHIPLKIHEVPSGTKVFDWLVPLEWNIRDAWIKDPEGIKIVDFRQSNLHIVNYSTPIHARMTLSRLKSHLHTLPKHPDWIPYQTSYYKENWGFCLTHSQFLTLWDGEYEVHVDSTLSDGHLTYGECLIPGDTTEEVLISTHICHPSMANDNLSGVSTATFLAKYLMKRPNRYSYRFLFIPGTIGAITWLQLNLEKLGRIRHGLVLAGLGDPGGICYKKSRRGNAVIDRVSAHIFQCLKFDAAIQEFSPYGYDERQFCSPGFDLPVGRLSRTPFGEYPQYHTSADNLDFIKMEALAESFSVIVEIVQLLDANVTLRNLKPYCEPQLGSRGLYDRIGPNQLAMLWVLNMSDGNHSLLDIAEKSGIAFDTIREVALLLHESELLG
jgi:aminopeptidase-like protein